MAPEARLLGILQVEAQDAQAALCGHRRIQLTEGAGRRIPGIGKQRLFLFFPQGVEPLEGLKGHIHLSPHHQPGDGCIDLQRDAVNGAQILGDILPHHSIAPGGSLIKKPIPVIQGHRKAVDLHFHRIEGLGELLLDLPVKVPQFLIGKHILQTLHGVIVAHLVKPLQRFAADALGGRIGSGPLGILLLQLAQLTGQSVIFKIGDLRGILFVIFFGMNNQLIGELIHLFLDGHGISSVPEDQGA